MGHKRRNSHNGIRFARDGLGDDYEKVSDDRRVLQIWRALGHRETDIICSSLISLKEVSDFPKLKVNTSNKKAYLLHPRMTPKNFNEGFIRGYQVAGITSGVRSRLDTSGYEVQLGKQGDNGEPVIVELLPSNRRTLILHFTSERFTEEKCGIRKSLADVGVKGYSQDGRRKGFREDTETSVSLANFEHYVRPEDEQELITRIEESILPQLGTEIWLGAVMINSIKVDRSLDTTD